MYNLYTLRLFNQGLTPGEIAEELEKLPARYQQCGTAPLAVKSGYRSKRHPEADPWTVYSNADRKSLSQGYAFIG